MSLFSHDIILYIEDPKDATRKLWELLNKFCKVAGYEINTQKSPAFLYTNNKWSEREIKKTIPLITATKIIKYLGLNLPKETKEKYSENYKNLMKEKKKMTQTDGEIYYVLDWIINIVKMTTTTSNLQIQCNPYQTTNGIFHMSTTKKFKFCKETQMTLIS